MNPEHAAAPTSSVYDEIWSDVYGELQDLGPVHRQMRRLLGRALRTLEYESALEVGCGAGHNFALLGAGRELPRLTGMDLSEGALKRAAGRHPDTELVLGDIQRAALEGRWELVFSALVLEHLPDDEAALRNMRAMCGRHLVVATIAGDYQRYRGWEEQVGHVRNYRPGELEAKLERAGFAVEESTYWGFPLYSPVVRTLQRGTTAEASFTGPQRLAARLLYWLYFLNSRRRGDLLIATAKVA